MIYQLNYRNFGKISWLACAVWETQFNFRIPEKWDVEKLCKRSYAKKLEKLSWLTENSDRNDVWETILKYQLNFRNFRKISLLIESLQKSLGNTVELQKTSKIIFITKQFNVSWNNMSESQPVNRNYAKKCEFTLSVPTRQMINKWHSHKWNI